MKKVIFALTLALSSSAFAGFQTETESDAGPYYMSWCTQDNKVASQTSTGGIKVDTDCTAEGKVCQQVEVKRRGISHIYATCN